MRILALVAASALALSLAAPAFAQDAMANGAMSSGPAMKMSAKDTKTMKKCNAMSHDMMMKNADCMKLMKTHPDMMGGDNMMSGH